MPPDFGQGVFNQDPTLSIPRQLARCREALPSYCVIVAFFWDVESGRTDLELRGHGDAYQMFKVPVPRDGAVADLLEESRRPDRRFVAVVCESVDRLARVTYFGTKIEYELEQSGVALLAADEGITDESLPTAGGPPVRKRATPTLTRRVKQAIAEWYVLDMLEKAWGGLVQHTEQGYNIGKPPYGYLATTETHPVPAKAAMGKVKHRLVRDPVRGPVVTAIYTWRVAERLSYDQIAERLNSDPGRYPPPQPILGRRRRAIGQWTKGSVRDVLSNPKYTGHMVYNRRKNPRAERGVHGRVNPPTEWVWSSKPTHEPLTTKTQFLAGTPIGQARQRSRTGDAPNRHPATTRTYRLRSHVICELCGRRLYGKVRRTDDPYRYYACEPVPTHHAGKPWFPGHPKSLWVREDKLLTIVRTFFANRIFGPNRVALLTDASDRPAVDDRTAELAALRGRIAELARQQTNLVAELRDYVSTGDEQIDQQWREQLRASFATVSTRRRDLEADLASRTAQAAPAAADPALLDELPVIEGDLADLPEELERELFRGFQLQVRYHHPTRRVTLRVTIDGQAIDQLTTTSRAAAQAAARRSLRTTRPPASDAGGQRSFSLLVCAPGATPTHTEWTRPSLPSGVMSRVPVDVDPWVVATSAERLGIDLHDREQVLDLVAVAMTRLAWRDGPVEDWHAVPCRRIGDAQMMRANAAITRRVRVVLERHLPRESPSIPLPRQNAGDLLNEMLAALTDTSQRLPDGRTVAQLAPDRQQLRLFDAHVRWYATLWHRTLTSHLDSGTSLGLFACYGARFCWRWWLAPAWPLLVDKFLRRLRDPERWRDPLISTDVRRLAGSSGMDLTGLRRLLLAGPDLLDGPTAAFCLRGGLGALLPQDCGLAGLPRWPLPVPYLRLIDCPPPRAR